MTGKSKEDWERDLSSVQNYLDDLMRPQENDLPFDEQERQFKQTRPERRAFFRKLRNQRRGRQ